MTIPKTSLPGLPASLSRLILGCDNKSTYDEGAPVWDAWIAAGGNSFDTAHIYGRGVSEAALGQWIARRGNADDIVVIAKGAHTPDCTPEAIGRQLTASLERLKLAYAPIYIMHRDNPDVPVGEFVDAVNREISRGRVGIWGGSNWSVARLADARAYAASRRLVGPSILNNNLSLAVMERPLWQGCLCSNAPETLDWLRRETVAHIAWSAQARGYFLPEPLRNRLPEDTRPETAFGSAANAERRRRAEALAPKFGVSANNVATAWVLAQDFQSLALVGPRDQIEIASTLPALSVELSAAEVAWLNLEGEFGTSLPTTSDVV
jgi:aryl-alcohol dehydrogenase-like predicted oxidoreductase